MARLVPGDRVTLTTERLDDSLHTIHGVIELEPDNDDMVYVLFDGDTFPVPVEIDRLWREKRKDG